MSDHNLNPVDLWSKLPQFGMVGDEN